MYTECVFEMGLDCGQMQCKFQSSTARQQGEAAAAGKCRLDLRTKQSMLASWSEMIVILGAGILL